MGHAPSSEAGYAQNVAGTADGQEWAECAFCGEMMQPEGWDPCSVEVWAAAEQVSWHFGAHAACVLASFHPEFRAAVASDYEFPANG
jgi:hypothetical protein